MHGKKERYVAQCLFGFEELLSKELKKIGIKKMEPIRRGVQFFADKEQLYRANLWSRIALRIWKPIIFFRARNEKELYHQASKLEWIDYMSPEHSFAISGLAFGKHFKHSKYVALKTKDALVDQMRYRYGKRPSVETENPDIRFQIHIAEDKVQISIDSSGLALHKRGYRNRTFPAPLNETLAAGMIALTDWHPSKTFYSPLCGSGTLAIEAAMIACNMAPGLHRKGFGFENWRDFDPELWDKIKEEAKERVAIRPNAVLASDSHSRAIDITERAAKTIGLEGSVECFRKDFQKTKAEGSTGTLIINPPYGERMNPEDLENLYAEIGDTLKKNYPGFKCWIISGNRDALKHVGLKTSKRIQLYNGKIPVYYFCYDLYEGSKKGTQAEGSLEEELDIVLGGDQNFETGEDELMVPMSDKKKGGRRDDKGYRKFKKEDGRKRRDDKGERKFKKEDGRKRRDDKGDRKFKKEDGRKRRDDKSAPKGRKEEPEKKKKTFVQVAKQRKKIPLKKKDSNKED